MIDHGEESAESPACERIAGWIARAKAGDALALQDLLREHYELLSSHIERRLPPHLERLCWGEDVLAETIAGIAQGISSFEPRRSNDPAGAFVSWIREIAEHRVIDLVRRERSQKRPPPERRIESSASLNGSTVGGGLSFADPGASPSRFARIDEFQSAVKSAMDRIYPPYREVVELRLTLGLSNAEIAARLGRDEAAIRKVLCRAIQQLREEIGDWSRYLSRG
ncbi:MAG: sigma-70 family RNA polymerase sigma factor [Phycisphaerales bacterium]